MRKKNMKRMNLPKEPTLHLHRYILAVYQSKRRVRYVYCLNQQEVADFKKNCDNKTYIEIYRATHDFKGAFFK